MAAGRIGSAELKDLAARRAELNQSFDVSALSRLAALGEASQGPADPAGPGRLNARLAFQPGLEGYPRVRVSVSGAARLLCQRCLKPLHWPVAVDATLTIVGSDEAAAALADPFETVLLADDELWLAEMVEDEVLASLPLAPMHVAGQDCGMPAGDVGTEGPAQAPGETQRPFSSLASLLTQGRQEDNE